MKTRMNRKVSLVVLAIASLSLSTYASGDIRITPVKESSKTNLKFEVQSRKDVNVSFTDPEGSSVQYDVERKNSGYYKVFDFSELDEGMYTLVTETGHTTITRTIELKDNTISVLHKKYAYQPVFEVEGDLLKVYFLNQKNDDISVSLEGYMKDYFKETGNNSTVYDKKLNLKNLPSGEYTFSLAVGEKEHNFSFRR